MTTPSQSDRESIATPLTEPDTEGHILRTYPGLVDDQSPRKRLPQDGADDVEGHRRVPQDDLAPRRVPPSDRND